MGTTADKLARIEQTKAEIRAAIIAKEVTVPADAVFREYPTYISQISGGGITPTGNIELQQQSGTDVTNYATASVKGGSITVPSITITAAPTISVSNSGLITASVSGSSAATASVTAGWIASGASNTVTVSGSSTNQLTVQAAKTITPTSSAQTAVARYRYTTGTITVAAVPTETKTATVNGDVTPTSGKFLSKVTVALPVKTYRTGTGTPSSSLGDDGDIYVDLS